MRLLPTLVTPNYLAVPLLHKHILGESLVRHPRAQVMSNGTRCVLAQDLRKSIRHISFERVISSHKASLASAHSV